MISGYTLVIWWSYSGHTMGIPWLCGCLEVAIHGMLRHVFGKVWGQADAQGDGEVVLVGEDPWQGGLRLHLVLRLGMAKPARLCAGSVWVFLL